PPAAMTGRPGPRCGGVSSINCHCRATTAARHPEPERLSRSLSMADLNTSIHQILDRYKAAVRARDVEALMRLYDPKVRVFDAWGIWSYEGADAWRTAVEGW